MARELQEHGFSKEYAKEFIMKGTKLEVIHEPSTYLNCTFFDNPNLQRHFVQTLQAQMNEYGYNYLDFCHIDGKKISFVVAQCSLVVGCRRFGGTRWLHLQAIVV
jgi:hypothetical protein